MQKRENSFVATSPGMLIPEEFQTRPFYSHRPLFLMPCRQNPQAFLYRKDAISDKKTG
ncbi:MAG: hypothetical protein ACLFM1_10855 [Bacteroidales bacterium]